MRLDVKGQPPVEGELDHVWLHAVLLLPLVLDLPPRAPGKEVADHRKVGTALRKREVKLLRVLRRPALGRRPPRVGPARHPALRVVGAFLLRDLVRVDGAPPVHGARDHALVRDDDLPVDEDDLFLSQGRISLGCLVRCFHYLGL